MLHNCSQCPGEIIPFPSALPPSDVLIILMSCTTVPDCTVEYCTVPGGNVDGSLLLLLELGAELLGVLLNIRVLHLPLPETRAETRRHV